MRTRFFAVGVKRKKTTKNIVIPMEAPIVTKIDHGDTKLNWFGGPSDIAKAKSGPNTRVRPVNTCTDLTNLGMTLKTNDRLPEAKAYQAKV